MRENNIPGLKSKELAKAIIRLKKKLCDEQHEFTMSNQILRSATSIGANLAEAEYSQSDADFLSKRSIALKEAAETHFWLELLVETGYITQEEYAPLESLTGEIIKLLVVGNQSIRDRIEGKR